MESIRHWNKPGPEQTSFETAFRAASDYLAHIDTRPVCATALREPPASLPEHGAPIESIVEYLAREGSASTVCTAGPRYFGYVIGGALPASVCASMLNAAWNQNAGMHLASPVAVELEQIALNWARELLGLPEGCSSALVTGATVANLCGLAAARHFLLERAGWDVESQGLYGAPEIRLVVGEEVHPSLMRGVALLGFGRDRAIRVPVDDQGRMRADALPPLDDRTILCIQAGNVNSGAFDPAVPLCEAARKAGAWVHVDGAFGLWAAASPKYRHLAEGFALADSWATDAHKWPNAGYDSGISFVRHAESLRNAMSMSAAYLPVTAPREPIHYTPEMSRRARGVELWAALRSLGRSGMADLVDRCCAYADQFARGLAADGHAILNHVELNQVLVSFGAPERTARVIAELQKEGTMWAGPTEWHGQYAMRISVSSWATRSEDIEMSLDAVRRVTRAIP